MTIGKPAETGIVFVLRTSGNPFPFRTPYPVVIARRNDEAISARCQRAGLRCANPAYGSCP